MGTGNFYNKNASRIFAFETEEEFDYEDNVDNIRYALKEKGFDEEDGYENGLRSFSGRYIASKTVSKDYHGMEVSATIKAICRSGYYSGANVDWELEYQYESQNTDEVNADYIAEELERYYDVKRGMALIQGKNAAKWLEKAGQALVDELEAVLEAYTTPLVVTARFSNGETWYGEASDKRSLLKSVANGEMES